MFADQRHSVGLESAGKPPWPDDLQQAGYRRLKPSLEVSVVNALCRVFEIVTENRSRGGGPTSVDHGDNFP